MQECGCIKKGDYTGTAPRFSCRLLTLIYVKEALEKYLEVCLAVSPVSVLS